MPQAAVSRRPLRSASGVALTATLLSVLGCKQTPNPSFPVTPSEARAALREMAAQPVEPTRPIVVVNGWLDRFSFGTGTLRSYLRDSFEPDRSINVAHPLFSNFDTLRDRLIARVDAAFPTDDPHQTTAVDAVGFSMGGLVARYAALPLEGRRRLNIARLYTVATPHRGAALATRWSLDPKIRAMHRDSWLFPLLNETPPDYELVPYVRLGDWIVGDHNAAPPATPASPGTPPWWVDAQPMQDTHLQTLTDPRILADLLRRLRDEQPFTVEPASGLP